MADFWEVHGWPKELYTLQGAAAERKIWCAWGDRFAVAAELDTYPTSIYPYNDTGAILNKLHIKNAPDSKHADVGSKGMISYQNAIITANYSTWGPSTAALITESLRVATMGTKWTHEGLYWSNDGTNPLKVNEGPQQLQPVTTYILHYHRLHAIPAGVYNLKGYMNSNTVFTKILGTYFEPFFLRYEGAYVNRTVTASGITMFSVKHYFSHAYNDGLGWTGVLRQSTGRYAKIYDADGNQRFPYYAAYLDL